MNEMKIVVHGCKARHKLNEKKQTDLLKVK